ncbi:MAG: TIGR01777 family oxidoreductase [Planctomycetota bacterium]
MSEHYEAQIELPVSIENAFAYHDRPGALQRLIPPWENVRIEQQAGSLEPGSRVVLVTRIGVIPVRWVAEHTAYEPPQRFADRQVSGPFALWEHEHRFESSSGHENSRLIDSIAYRLPLGALGGVFGGGQALRTIEAMFAYRHRVTRDDLSLLEKYKLEPKTIAVSGASGLVGKNLCAMLRLLGHRVLRIVRRPEESEDTIAVWDQPSDAKRLGECDFVIHLAGKSIASGRWNESIKREIRDSRVVKTQKLAQTIADLDGDRPDLICASATGIFGDRGDEVLTEATPIADDFLASVAEEWEAACDPARQAGCRVVNARFGIVLDPNDGALQKCLLPAKFFGGALGNGKQYWSWIALDDVLGGLYHCMANEGLSGPVNFTSPQPLQNSQFAKTLAKVLSRVALFPAPAFALRLALGEMENGWLLASTRVEPRKLIDSGYSFRFQDLETFLRYALGKDKKPNQYGAPENR